jgi:hypothetical protein
MMFFPVCDQDTLVIIAAATVNRPDPFFRTKEGKQPLPLLKLRSGCSLTGRFGDGAITRQGRAGCYYSDRRLSGPTVHNRPKVGQWAIDLSQRTG